MLNIHSYISHLIAIERKANLPMTGKNNIKVGQHQFYRTSLDCLYMNDLPRVSKVLLFYIFVDYTRKYYEAQDLIPFQKIMNRELKKVRKWLKAN